MKASKIRFVVRQKQSYVERDLAITLSMFWYFEHHQPNALQCVMFRWAIVWAKAPNLSSSEQSSTIILWIRWRRISAAAATSQSLLLKTKLNSNIGTNRWLHCIFCSNWDQKQGSIPQMHPCIHNIKKALTSRTMALLIREKQSAYSQSLTFTHQICAVLITTQGGRGPEINEALRKCNL